MESKGVRLKGEGRRTNQRSKVKGVIIALKARAAYSTWLKHTSFISSYLHFSPFYYLRSLN